MMEKCTRFVESISTMNKKRSMDLLIRMLNTSLLIKMRYRSVTMSILLTKKAITVIFKVLFLPIQAVLRMPHPYITTMETIMRMREKPM